jgi:hypothetical protein
LEDVPIKGICLQPIITDNDMKKMAFTAFCMVNAISVLHLVVPEA